MASKRKPASPGPKSRPARKPAAARSSHPQPESHAYWRANLRLIGVLLAVWAGVSLGAGLLFAGKLNQFSILGVPAGFFIAQQGAIYVFVLLIWVYAKKMDSIDHGHGVKEREGDR